MLTDISEYNKQILEEVKADTANILRYYEIFIKFEDLQLDIWFENWNIFNWSEDKFIKSSSRSFILNNINYWRETGKLPTYYNLNIKST